MTAGAEPSFRMLHEDEHKCAIVKPNRLLTHRIDIDFHEPYNLRDPNVGDSKYSDRKHNRFVADQTKADSLLLYAGKLKIEHPYGKRILNLEARVPHSWNDISDSWPWKAYLSTVPLKYAVTL